MEKFIRNVTQSDATAHASLAVLGVKLQEIDLLAPIRTLVHIPQKVIDYTPFEKLSDCFIGFLAGAKGISDIERVLRECPALQAAFGRTACAEQSTIQDTLDACTSLTTLQMAGAMKQIFRQHSQAYRHPFAQELLLLDLDMTGNPCGRKAACATKGYFAGQKNRRGRQVGRVLATPYGEIVIDRVFPGNVQLSGALPTLLRAAEETLGLTAEQRARTILRMDSGGGSVDDVNAVLERGYMVLCKDYSAARARKLTQSVERWYPDPKEAGREVGVVTTPATAYVRPVERIAVRYRKRNGQWGTEVLINTVPQEEIARRVAPPQGTEDAEHARLLATTYFYDGRGGACETSFQGGKQGLAMTKKNKKRFEAQEMVTQLLALVHNVLVWAKGWLKPSAPRLEAYGMLRLVRDVLGILGRVEQDAGGRVRRIVLNERSRLAQHCLTAFQQLVVATGVLVVLGKP
jgi:hypothetical protein